MKAFLLAAGEGTRLRPITNSIPKCLAPIRGRPVLDIWLEHCANSGIDEVLVNLHAHAQAVRSFVQGRNYGTRIQISHEPALLGSAGTLFANRQWVDSEAYFWVFYADVLTNLNLSAMLDHHVNHDLAATLGVYEVDNPARCGIMQVDRGE